MTQSSSTHSPPPAYELCFVVVALCSVLTTTGAQPSSNPVTSTVAPTSSLPATTSTTSAGSATTSTTSAGSATTSTTSAGSATTTAPVARHYVLTNGSDVPCAAISCTFNITIPYNTTTGTPSSYVFTPPCSGETGVYVNGTCGSQQESMVINFMGKQWLLRFDLGKHQDRFSLNGVYLVYIQETALFPNVAEPGKIVTYNATGLDLFDTPYGRYYSCQADVTHDLGHGYLMKTRHFEILAFTNSTNTTGLAKTVCTADKPIVDNTVPIAVGAALAALVVIVVVAYFISRRAMRGYQSV